MNGTECGDPAAGMAEAAAIEAEDLTARSRPRSGFARLPFPTQASKQSELKSVNLYL